MVDTSEHVLTQFADFESLRTHHVEIPFSEGGWLRLVRDNRGYITVRYRIAGWKASAVMEGEVAVEGEFAGSFCCELGAMLEAVD